MIQTMLKGRNLQWMGLGTGVLTLLLCVLVTYAFVLRDLIGTWWSDPNYHHALLVPAFSAALLWKRREQLALGQFHGSWLGIVLFCVAGAMRLPGRLITCIDRFSLLPCIAGFVFVAAGRRGWRWAWPSVAFLLFMVPLPELCVDLASRPLQRASTQLSAFVLQLFGVPACAFGNTILLRRSQVGVIAACSGLRTIEMCLALSVAAALMLRAGWQKRLLVAASAIPIALTLNVLRITVVAGLQEWQGSELTDQFHDVVGWFVMPAAIVLLWCEVSHFSARRTASHGTSTRGGVPILTNPNREAGSLQREGLDKSLDVPRLAGGGVWGSSRLYLLATLPLWLGYGAALAFLPAPGTSARYPNTDLAGVPDCLGSWHAVELPAGASNLARPGDAAVAVGRCYRAASGREITLELEAFLITRILLHPPEVCYEMRGSTLLHSVELPITVDEHATIPARLLTIQTNAGRDYVLYWYQRNGDFVMDRSGMWRNHWTYRNEDPQPPLVKVFLQTSGNEGDKVVEELRSLAQPLAEWTRRIR